MHAPVLMTERLELRPFAPEDADELHAVFTDPCVRRWLLDDQVVTRDWVDAEIAKSESRFAGGSAGLWSLRERARLPIVGFVGYRPFFDPPETQLLYGLLPRWQGRGLATEASAAALDYAFEQLGFPEVCAATDVPNTASIAVLERLGMRQTRRSEDTIFFKLRATDGAVRTGTTQPLQPPAPRG